MSFKTAGVKTRCVTHIVIDGYNLIRQSPTLKDIEADDFEEGRLALVEKLGAYKKLHPHRITVVFDATYTDNLYVEESKLRGIRILYSEGGQTADQVIMEMARQDRDRLLVVSSDKEILKAARSAGCAVLEAPQFERKLDEALLYEGSPVRDEEEVKPIHKRWATKKKGPSKRLPKAQRRGLSRLKNL